MRLGPFWGIASFLDWAAGLYLKAVHRVRHGRAERTGAIDADDRAHQGWQGPEGLSFAVSFGCTP
jgi:hypothetical protein